MIVIPQGPFDESLDRALLRLAADVRRTWDWSTRLLVLVIFGPGGRRGGMLVPLLRGVGVNAMRSRDHDLLALIVVRLIVIPVAGADEPVTAFILVDLGGELPVVVEVVCAPASMADATLSSDWRGAPMGPCTDRPPGSGDVLVLVVRLIVLLDVGSRSQEGLNEVHPDRIPGPRAVHELAAAADVPRNHGSGGLDPQKEEGGDQNHTGRRQERERRPVSVKPTRLVIDLDPVDARLVGSAPGLSGPPSARCLLICVFGAAGPEEATEKSHTHPSEVGQTSV